MVLMRISYDKQEPFPSASKDIARSLRICIIGAGVTGLSTALALRKAGFQLIEIYEGASTLREAGAGIQCAPNMARILSSLGLLEDLRPYAVTLSGSSLRRELNVTATHPRISTLAGWKDDTVLAQPSTLPLAEQIYGFPAWVVHRADLQSILLRSVQEHRIPVYTKRRVRDIEFAKSTVVFEDGRRVKSDVILAADGMYCTSPVG
jgi:salicylate hydroxylase